MNWMISIWAPVKFLLLFTMANSDYYYDQEAGERPIGFIENYCTHVKGSLAGKPFILADWQKDDIIRPLFGWKHKKNHLRRFRTIYIEIPKKNGKTLLGSAIALYCLFSDGEKGAEIYSAAAERDQAAISFDIASKIVKNNRSLSARSTVLLKSIAHDNGSFYKALSAQANTKHGYNSYVVIFDEMHVQKDNKLYDALETGTASRDQPIMFVITTAGVKREDEMGWEMHEYARKVQEDIIPDETFLTVMYGADAKDDPYAESTWKKANPNYGNGVNKEYIAAKALVAKNRPTYKNTFLRYHLNIWTSTEVSWMDSSKWNKCNLKEICEDDFIGEKCIAAIDLASTSDFTAMVLLFKRDEMFHALPYFWIPEDSLKDRKNEEMLRVWIEAGYIIATPGNITDYNFIEEKIKQLNNKFNIHEVPFDDWNSTQLTTNLEAEGFNTVKHGQGYKSMSPASKELERLLLSRKLNHGGNPVLSWMNSNVTMVGDAAGNIKPDKKKSSEKIDGMICLIMTVGRIIFGDFDEDTGSVYDDGEVIVL